MRGRSASNSGFSLMEVMVALTILSSTAVAFMSLARGSVETAQQIEDKYLARIVADNQMVDLFWQAEPVEQGVTDGVERQMGREFSWVRSILPGPREGVLLVTIQVRRASEDETVLAEVATLKGVPS